MAGEHLNWDDITPKLTISQINAARALAPSMLAEVLQQRREALNIQKQRTPGTFELGVSNVPIDHNAFVADWRVNLPPDDLVRIQAQEAGDIVEIGSPRDVANMAAALAFVDEGIAEDQERIARNPHIC